MKALSNAISTTVIANAEPDYKIGQDYYQDNSSHEEQKKWWVVSGE